MDTSIHYSTQTPRTAQFDWQEVLGRAGRDDGNTFDNFIQHVETFSVRPLSTMAQVRAHDARKIKGDIWEVFCCRWLVATGRADEAYLLHDVPPAWLQTLGLRRQDLGIDIVARVKDAFVAVQAKYRAWSPLRAALRVNWGQLATFFALVARTGPWRSHIVMTNSAGVTWKVKKTAKDKTLAHGTFRRTPLDVWLTLMGNQGQTLTAAQPAPPPLTKPQRRLSLRSLRLKRQAYFEQQAKEANAAT